MSSTRQDVHDTETRPWSLMTDRLHTWRPNGAILCGIWENESWAVGCSLGSVAGGDTCLICTHIFFFFLVWANTTVCSEVATPSSVCSLSSFLILFWSQWSCLGFWWFSYFHFHWPILQEGLRGASTEMMTRGIQHADSGPDDRL